MRSALILAAHGSRTDPSSNDVVRAYARQLAGLSSFDEVVAAFNHGHPAYAEVLDRIEADDVTVVPLMTSAGYFSEFVLPRELARNVRFPGVHLRRTMPIGLHPRMGSIVERRVRTLISENGLDGDATSLVVVGHGTERYARSRSATVDLAGLLDRTGMCSETLYAFLDDDPRVETVPDRATRMSIIVIPYLIGNGPHARKDIPARLGMDAQEDDSGPLRGHAGDRLVICDAAVGADPAIVNIVAELAEVPR